MNDYPTDEELEKIKTWDAMDFHGLMEYVSELWNFREWGWERKGESYHVSTGGWSGNEDIVGAMQSNVVWWALNWEQTRRGGHYIFSNVSEKYKTGETA